LEHSYTKSETSQFEFYDLMATIISIQVSLIIRRDRFSFFFPLRFYTPLYTYQRESCMTSIPNNAKSEHVTTGFFGLSKIPSFRFHNMRITKEFTHSLQPIISSNSNQNRTSKLHTWSALTHPYSEPLRPYA
jgi:hypothetical protein